MDIAEASAMTEASGLENDQARIEHASEAIRDMAHGMKENAAALASGSRAASQPLADRLARMTRAAPLHALAITFLLGVLLGRRR
jgi:hypothetical protein